MENDKNDKVEIVKNDAPENMGIEGLLNSVFAYSLRLGIEYGKEILEKCNGDLNKVKEELGDLCDTAMSILNEFKLK